MTGWLTRLRRRVRLVVNRERVEAEMREEMAYHVERDARERERAGVPADAAHRAATLAFGGVEAHKEDARDARGGRWFDDLRDDLAYARRQMLRSPVAALATVAILGVGVAGAGLAFSVTRAYLLRALPVPEPERLAYVIPAANRNAFATVPDLRAVDWKAAAAEFAGTAAWDLDGFTLIGGSAPEYVDGAWVSPGYFDLLGASVVRGRPFREEEYRPGNRVALISTDLWRRRFGGADSVVGLTLRLHSTDRPDEQELVTIVGVLAPQGWRVNRFQDLLRPLGEPRMFSLARLPVGASLDEGGARLTRSVRPQVTATDSSWRMTLVSALDEHVYRLRPMLRVLMGVAALLLVLAVASAGALLIARGDERAQEMTIRRALGATAGRLTRQLGVEAAVTWSTATALGLAVTAFFARQVAAGIEGVAGVSVPGGIASVGLDAPTVLFVMVASAVPFVLLGFAPLVRVLTTGAAALRPGSRVTASRTSAGARRGLVMVQVALAVALMINAALLLKSVRGMASEPLGFDSAHLLKAHLLLPRTRYPDANAQLRAGEALIANVETVPGVTAATIVHPHPFRGTVSTAIECDGCDGPGAGALRATPQTIAPNYFRAMGIPVGAGRQFEAQDVAGSLPVAVVSRALAERWGSAQAAVGRRVRVRTAANDGTWLTIVGVVGDVRKTYGDTILPDVYTALAQNPRAYFALMVRTEGAPQAATVPVARAVASVDEALALSGVEAMDDVLRARSGGQRILAGFASGAATLALVLTASALYAVIAYLTLRRRREFAVRAALGAKGGEIAALVLREGSRLLVRGAVIGVAVAAVGGLLVRSQLFGVTAFDAPTYLTSVLGVAVIAAVALAIPALRAARWTPAEVLREDG